MSIAIVVAVAKNGVIGADNRLLWRLKTDLRHFRELTIGKPVVMGRKTFESIGRPLPGRDNIVVTRDHGFSAEGVHVVHGLDEALALGRKLAEARGTPDVMIAGGGEIYRQAMALADRLHVTEVDLSPEGDALFPRIDPKLWRETSREAHPRGPDNESAFTFVDYLRR
jgi:dihydrofolate reductase